MQQAFVKNKTNSCVEDTDTSSQKNFFAAG
jgi:hypothetical protein